jgi:hypothetical protein
VDIVTAGIGVGQEAILDIEVEMKSPQRAFRIRCSLIAPPRCRHSQRPVIIAFRFKRAKGDHGPMS